ERAVAASGPLMPAVGKPAAATCAASTLFDWYGAQDKTLPTVSERSKIYASLSLGIESYYTGTAEQNTKLLAALKRQAGCF
ncbi:MAG: hypothetical protein AAB964_01740, partial [Patescibacteria group bacterium]